ncbi:hypothetical protein TcBrA4_0068030 [Trypanosoma cruzi]|nr:hypothetical protein TcBrA4_0068030 [Trypanosoma cruzi]
MNDLPHMIAERQGPASEVAKGRKRRSGTPPTKSGCALLVDYFTSAAAPDPQGDSDRRGVKSPGRETAVLERRVRRLSHPHFWKNFGGMYFGSVLIGSRCPHGIRRDAAARMATAVLRGARAFCPRRPSRCRVAAVSRIHLVCSAPTGSGKSSLVPLFLLGLSLDRLLERIDASSGRLHSDGPRVRDGATSVPPPMPFFVTGSSREFVAEFGASSRLCIVVSAAHTSRMCGVGEVYRLLFYCHQQQQQTLHPDDVAQVGGRVGYAVGGDKCFSPATEIIYATPGYILNAVLHKGGLLAPTTLIIDEAHCRDMETDLLLAWAKQQLREKGERQLQLRQLVLMSATLPVEEMVALFTSRLHAIKAETPSGENVAAFSPHILLVDAEERQQTGCGDAGKPSRFPLSRIVWKNILSTIFPTPLERPKCFVEA